MAASVIDLSLLNPAQGFIIQGDADGDRAGWSVSSAGDINGDGFADLIVGAAGGDNGGINAGEAYVIFGKAGATRTNIDLTSLAASDGFIIQGDVAGDRAGFSVSSAGDVNGDGFADLIVGAPSGGNGGIAAGEAYVIFGKAGATRTNIDLTSLAASNGFFIQGDYGGDEAGFSVSSAGDINGDGFADLIVGAPYGDNGGYDAGEAYVIFGKAGATRTSIDLTTLAASDGFIIQGDAEFDAAGMSVSSAGDINGDGFADMIVGAHRGDNGGLDAGEAYVIFGKAGATRANIDLTSLATSDGFIIQGDAAYDYAGFSVSSAGDVNGDGFADLIVGAPVREYGGTDPGEAYVIFGKAGATRANINLTSLPASDGFIIQGDVAFDFAGCSVSSAGDINGDGFADLIVGARWGDNGGIDAGEAYVIFGKAGAARANIDLTSLAASDGFIIQGDAAGDQAGCSVSSAGDINGDSFADLIVGAPFGDNGGSYAGEAYVIFGRAGIGSTVNQAPTAAPVTLAAIAEDSGVRTITAAQLLAGGADVDGPALSITAFTLTSGNGTLTDNADGTWSYTPAANDDTAAAFAYTVSDGSLSASSTASLDITPVGDAPTAAPVTLAATAEDSGVRTITAAQLLAGAADVDSLALTITAFSLTSGNGTLVNNGNGTWSYTPAANDDTAATFDYIVSDGTLSASSTASLDLTPVNDAPTAAPVTLAAIAEDSGVRTITAAQLLAGAADADGPTLSITAFTLTSGNGTLTDNGDGTWSYTPAANDDTAAAFAYTVSDGSLTASSTASLDVTPVGDAPTAAPVTLAAIAEDSGARIITAAQLLVGAADVDSPALSITAFSLTSGNGTLVNNGNGTWSYTPAANDDTAAVFAYTVSDGSLSANSTASLDITPVNDAPVIISNGGGATASLSIAEHRTAVTTITSTDADTGATRAFSIAGGADAARFQINATTGALSFLTAPNFEAPADAGGNNVYDVIVRVSDGPLFDSQAIMVSVQNALESYVGTSGDNVFTAPDADAWTITGLGGNDTLGGNSGNDSIDGGTGVDTMTGGFGDDIYYVDNTADVVTEAANQGTDTIFASANYSLAGRFVEVLTLTGTANINATGNSQAQTLNGNSGNNTLLGLQGVDRLNGGAGIDTLEGGAGNDTLDGGTGVDTLRGGTENDTYFVDDTADAVFEAANEGTDTVFALANYSLAGRFVEVLTLTGTANLNATGNSQIQTLNGNSGNNTLLGLQGNDVLNGGAGNDTLDGGTGVDTMRGGLNDDIYFVDSAADVVTEAFNEGTDTIFSSVAYSLAGRFVEVLSLTGTANINATGNSQAQTLIGNDAANTLSGLAGVDVLDGRGGADTLSGGTGRDTFAFSTALGVGNIDTISDFSVVDDTVQLAKTIFTGLTGSGLAASAFFIGSGASTIDHRIIYNSASGALLFDSDGSGSSAAVQFATLTTGLAMTAADFILV